MRVWTGADSKKAWLKSRVQVADRRPPNATPSLTRYWQLGTARPRASRSASNTFPRLIDTSKSSTVQHSQHKSQLLQIAIGQKAGTGTFQANNFPPVRTLPRSTYSLFLNADPHDTLAWHMDGAVLAAATIAQRRCVHGEVTVWPWPLMS